MFQHENDPNVFDQDSPSAIVSLGMPKTINIFPKHDVLEVPCYSLTLEPNSVFVMNSVFKKHYSYKFSHSQGEGLRISLKFQVTARTVSSITPTGIVNVPRVDADVNNKYNTVKNQNTDLHVTSNSTPPTKHTLIIGTSMVSDFDQWRLSRYASQVSVFSYPGATYSRLTSKIKNISENLYVSANKVSKIIIFVGSNDVCSNRSMVDCFADFDLLIAEIKKIFPAAVISPISILPISQHGRYTKRFIISRMYSMNTHMQYLCEWVPPGTFKLEFINIFWKFINIASSSNKYFKSELFKDDGLHLNTKGVSLVCKTLIHYIHKKD